MGRTKYALHQYLFLVIIKHMMKKQGCLSDLEAFIPKKDEKEMLIDELINITSGKYKCMKRSIKEVEEI